MNRRRRSRRRPAAYRRKKIEVNFLPIIVIICLSVCAGYLTAKYVVYPILGYEPAGLNILKEKAADEKKKETESSKENEKETTAATQSEAETKAQETTEQKATTAPGSIVEDQVDVKQAAGYALQFGSYSTKAAAEKSVSQLKKSGIKAHTVKKDGSYKVIGELFDTKEQAKANLEKMDASVGAFVTTVEK